MEPENSGDKKDPPKTPKKNQSKASMPMFSPSMSGKRKLCHSADRFIPERTQLNYDTLYQLHREPTFGSPQKGQSRPNETSSSKLMREESETIYSQVLRTELFDARMNNTSKSQVVQAFDHSTQVANGNSRRTPSPKKNILNFKSPTKMSSLRKLDFNIVHASSFNPKDSKFSTTPITEASQKALQSPKKPTRYISKNPFKVLDAPELADDFYLNVVDWGSNNALSVGLGSCVYLWSACTSRVTKLCDLGSYDSVCSVNWIQRGTHLAIGTNRGLVQIWDVDQGKKIRTMTGHTARVGTMAWNDHILTSGSRDRQILHRDVRCQENVIKKLSGHIQEVCGLKWNTQDNQLASGGNDNRLFVWDKMSETPRYRFSGHSAAVKAITWSPHQHGLLASGGGTADRKIRFWNTLTGTPVNCIDTGSQVCNLAWSKTSNEIVSTHGYSQNQVVIWKYPSMQQLATLTGHTYRVLYLAMSPDGQTIVTGAGDETLRFWNVFQKARNANGSENLFSNSSYIR